MAAVSAPLALGTVKLCTVTATLEPSTKQTQYKVCSPDWLGRGWLCPLVMYSWRGLGDVWGRCALATAQGKEFVSVTPLTRATLQLVTVFSFCAGGSVVARGGEARNEQ